MPAIPTLIEAVNDRAIFAPHFRDASSWRAWWAFGKAIFALPMDDEEFSIFQSCTGRAERPTQRANEAWLIVGRRGGKSRFLALVAAYLAAFIDWQQYLSPGERGSIVVVAADRRQCRVIMGYVRAFIAHTELLADLITRDTTEELELSNGLTIEVVTCSYRTARGRTVIAVLADEVAFWSDDDGANPASEVIASLRPAMATIPGAMMLIGSSPYSRRGPLWDAYKRWWGKSGAPIVWKAPTWIMNRSIAQDGPVITEAYERDEASARAEYGAEFRSDLEEFVAREVVEACVATGVFERPPIGKLAYRAFVDPSGGSNDSMTLAIAHAESGRVLLDAVRERVPPFSPENVVTDYVDLLHRYRVNEVVGDRYAGEWPREQFRKNNIAYTVGEKVRSDLYRDMLPELNSGRVELLDHPKLVNQIVGLERRVARGGRESIDHAPNGHDDVANAVAGAITLCARPKSTYTLEHVI